MNKSYRIKTNIGSNADKSIKLKLDQEVDTFEILSLKIDQKDIYEAFNCDYGIIIGRVNANDSVGIPNAKISIFIPVTDDDKQNAEIMAIYPYENPRDKNSGGKRYNLLPRVAQVQTDGTVRPKQPFGTFPTKEETVTNNTWLEVYDKYYKFSTVTNESGDYMLFGVPVGTQSVHMSVDITDIGQFSMSPATMVTNLGYSPNLFTDNGTKIKPSTDLDDLPNIETQEITVDVIPFCGDNEVFDIGITRQDFRIRAELVSTFTFFGSGFTDGENESWIEDEASAINKKIRDIYRHHGNTPQMATNRAGEVTEQIFYYPPNVTDAEIANPALDPTEERMFLLDDSQYAKFHNEGDFVYIIPCNRNKVITNEEGELVPVPDDNPAGAFTKFKGFVTLEISNDSLSIGGNYFYENREIVPLRYRYKFPQSSTTLGDVFESTDEGTVINAWRKQHHTFELDKIYSVARFHATVFNDKDRDATNNRVSGIHGFINNNNAGGVHDLPNRLAGVFSTYNVGVILTEDVGEIQNSLKQFPPNKTDGSRFGGNWMNFSVYFNQNGRFLGDSTSFNKMKSNTHFKRNDDQSYFLIDSNTQPIAANILNTQWFPRVDLHFTDIIEVPKEDIINMNKFTTKGFKNSEFGFLTGGDSLADPTIYKNGQDVVPVAGAGDVAQGSGKINGDTTETADTDVYFYKGLDGSNCTQFMADLGLV